MVMQVRQFAASVVAAMGLAGVAAAGPPAASAGPRPPITVPIDLVSNLPFMPVRVNGSRPLDGILDSGAGVSVVAPPVADELGLQSAGSVKAGGFGQGADQTLRLVDGAALGWGVAPDTATLSGQTIAVLPLDFIGSQTGHRTDALFGSNLFRSFRVTVDYARRKAVFAPFDAPLGAPGVAIPIDVSGNVPVVDVVLAGANGAQVKARLVVDIGTTGALILSKPFMQAHPELSAGRRWVQAPSASAVGGVFAFRLIRLTGLTLGPFQLAAPIAAVPDGASGVLATPGLAGLLGGEVLKRFSVTWDYHSRQMWLVPNTALHRPFPADASGLHLVARGANLEQIFIDEVLPGSVAHRAGLRPGDRITAANGKPLRLWELGEVLTHSGSVVSLTVTRDGVERRVRLRLQALL